MIAISKDGFTYAQLTTFTGSFNLRFAFVFASPYNLCNNLFSFHLSFQVTEDCSTAQETLVGDGLEYSSLDMDVSSSPLLISKAVYQTWFTHTAGQYSLAECLSLTYKLCQDAACTTDLDASSAVQIDVSENIKVSVATAYDTIEVYLEANSPRAPA